MIAISAAGKLMDADHSLRKPIKIEALLKLLERSWKTAAIDLVKVARPADCLFSFSRRPGVRKTRSRV